MKKRSGKGSRILGIFIFLLILAAAAAGFYFVYFQFQLPADTYGVIFTKINGWNSEIVKPGEIRIEWEGLIPNNLKIEKFDLLPRQSTVSAGGTLPSADAYSIYLEGQPDFSFKYSFNITYRIKPEALPELAAAGFLRPASLTAWYDDFESRLVIEAVNYITVKAEDSRYMERISYNYRLMEDDLKSDLSETFPDIDFIRFTPAEVSFPDMSLYTEGRKQYFSMVNYKSELEKEALRQTSEKLVKETIKIEILEKYGAVFNKYPELIDYYTLFREEGRALLPPIELPAVEE